MELNNIYLNKEHIDLIFSKLDIKDKTSFIQINKYINNVYKKSLKDLIFNYINTDYKDFFYLFKRYSYSSSEMEVLKEKSIYGINAVDAGVYKYYDLRFIFELVYKYSGIYDNYEYPKDKENIGDIILGIKDSISFDRFETINNMNHKSELYSLSRYFKPLLWKTKEDKWTELFI